MNLIKTQELGKPRTKVIPKPIKTIVERMHELRENKKVRQEKEQKKNFNVLTLIDEVIK